MDSQLNTGDLSSENINAVTDSVLSSLEFDFDAFRDKNYLTHNYHPYPAKFVPQIPHKIISLLSKPDEIVWIFLNKLDKVSALLELSKGSVLFNLSSIF